MKTPIRVAVSLVVFAICNIGCNNSERERQMKSLADKDSVLLQQSQQKDSTIMAYVRSLNDIQDNLNTIKAKEHIISMSKENGGRDSVSGSIIRDIKSLNALIERNHREVYSLQKRLASSNKEDQELKKMIANFSKELSEKDIEIAQLEMKLSMANDSLRLIVAEFNDSMVVINRQRMEIGAMKTEMNTVYYAIGTYKELKDKNVLTKEGGVIGMGRETALKQDFNTSYFTSALMPDLTDIQLYGKFVKVVTSHPSNSYGIVNRADGDFLVIKDHASFWSQTKYLVVVIKQQKSHKEEVSVADSLQ